MSVATKGVFIVGGKRTPFGAFGGAFKNTTPVELLTFAAVDALKQANVNPEKVDSVNIGNVMPHSTADGGLIPRHVALRSGIPIERPALGVNRLCGSGFQAVINGAQDILTGVARITLTGGTENMSMLPYMVRGVRFGTTLGANYEFGDSLFLSSIDTYCKLTMPQTAEKLAQQYNISRQEVDEFALKSQQRWKAAQDAGIFKTEITPVKVIIKKKEVEVTMDQHPRPQTTMEALAKLPVLFKGGVLTAGNSSGINDGAGAIILASEEAVTQDGLQPLARVLGWSVVGVEPSTMGIGPVPAIQNLLRVTNTKLDDIDLIEINEAFASQTLACAKALNLDLDRLNVNGGAIAMGHPVGASGARITAHLAYQMRQRGVKKSIAAACIGGGQGIALLFEAV